MKGRCYPLITGYSEGLQRQHLCSTSLLPRYREGNILGENRVGESLHAKEIEPDEESGSESHPLQWETFLECLKHKRFF